MVALRVIEAVVLLVGGVAAVGSTVALVGLIVFCAAREVVKEHRAHRGSGRSD